MRDKNEKNVQEEKEQENSNENAIGELEKSIELLQNERDDLKDKLLRKAAEFENYKRRTEQEFSSMVKYAGEQILTDILTVLDDFERSLIAGKDRRDFGPFYKGVELIYQKFKSILESKGVKPIDSLGKQFDVDLHDALMQVPDEKSPPDTIIEEVEKGYFYNDKVIRHAKVVVSREPDGSPEDTGDPSREELSGKEKK